MFRYVSITLVILFCVLFVCFYGKNKKENYKPIKGNFYVWQQQWNAKLETDILKSKRNFSILIAEFSKAKGHKKYKQISIPKDIFDKKNITWVIRISADYIKQMPLEKVLALIKKYKIKKIQFDVDVPESKLNLYLKFIENIKKKLYKNNKKLEISITALPVHLKHSEFKEISKNIDYYVLQVHGINFPKNVNDACSLMKKNITIKAIAKAQKIGRKFQIALPTYGYVLCFDKTNGKFKKLAAENANLINLRKNYNLKLIKPNIKLIEKILKNYRKGEDIIWFRYPVEKDTLNFDLKTIEKIEKCEKIGKKITFALKRVGNNQINLYIKNEGAISINKINLHLQWHGLKNGEFDLFCRTLNRSKNRAYAVLPINLRCEIPPCGKRKQIASFYIETEKLPTVTIEQ